jgi:hypothetical protein
MLHDDNTIINQILALLAPLQILDFLHLTRVKSDLQAELLQPANPLWLAGYPVQPHRNEISSIFVNVLHLAVTRAP